MKQWRRKRAKGLILAFAVAAAVAVPTAQAKPTSANTVKTTTTTISRGDLARWQAMNALYKPAASFYSPQAIQALRARSEGMNTRFKPASSFYTPQAYQALVDRSEAMNARYSQIASTTSQDVRDHTQVANLVREATSPVETTTGGFDWGDASIGAGTAVGAAIVLLSSLMVARRGRHGELAV